MNDDQTYKKYTKYKLKKHRINRETPIEEVHRLFVKYRAIVQFEGPWNGKKRVRIVLHRAYSDGGRESGESFNGYGRFLYDAFNEAHQMMEKAPRSDRAQRGPIPLPPFFK